MKATIAMNDQGIFWTDEKADKQDIPWAKSSSWWKHFFRRVNASFQAPFKSEWESKCGLHWREWAKL
jgi:hypothetical protein